MCRLCRQKRDTRYDSVAALSDALYKITCFRGNAAHPLLLLLPFWCVLISSREKIGNNGVQSLCKHEK